jgi:hypothetical protein
MTRWTYPSTQSELVRVGDRERADAADRLSAHAAAGRLTIDELEERLERVQAAVFARDLVAVEADLPAPSRRREPPRVPSLRALLLLWLLVAVLTTAVSGHPVAPLFLAAVLLWRAGHRNRFMTPRSLP